MRKCSDELYDFDFVNRKHENKDGDSAIYKWEAEPLRCKLYRRGIYSLPAISMAWSALYAPIDQQIYSRRMGWM
jgi:hypothetical protein